VKRRERGRREGARRDREGGMVVGEWEEGKDGGREVMYGGRVGVPKYVPVGSCTVADYRAHWTFEIGDGTAIEY